MASPVTAKLQVDGCDEREVIYVQYQFNQQIDVEGQPTGTTRGGVINVRVKSTDSGNTDLLDWTCDSYGAKNGSITWPNKIGGIMKTLSFVDAYCVSYEEVYDDSNTERMYESITITCRQLTVSGKGSVEYDNHWAL